MPLLPLTWLRPLRPLLAPLRVLARDGWLREADIDAVLAALNPAWALNRVFVRVEARQWVADDMLALRLRPNANWRGARPGQHLQLFIEHDGVRLGRTYSLIGEEGGCLEIAVKRQPEGRVSPLLLGQLCVGDVLELGAPGGDLQWPQDERGVLLLAAGSGLTPLLGLLRQALADGYRGPITLLHYVRERGQRAFHDQLQALAKQFPNFTPRWAISGAEADAGDLHGRFRREHLRDLAGEHVLACGPAGFVDAVRESLDERAASLQWEAFSAPAWTGEEARREVRLHFARSGQQSHGDNQRSLLEQAEAAGLRPAHGCRQGICASCTCTLFSGSVRDLRSGELHSEPQQPIRLCVSAPQGDVSLDL